MNSAETIGAGLTPAEWNYKLLEIIPYLLQADSADQLPPEVDMTAMDFAEYLLSLLRGQSEIVHQLNKEMLTDLLTSLRLLKADYNSGGVNLTEMIDDILSAQTPEAIAAQTRARIQ